MKTLEQLTEELSEIIGSYFDEDAISEYVDEILGLEYALEIDTDELAEQIEDNYQGQYSDGAEFAEQIIADCGELPANLPSWIASHIDYDAIWNCELIHDYTETTSGYIFRRD